MQFAYNSFPEKIVKLNLNLNNISKGIKFHSIEIIPKFKENYDENIISISFCSEDTQSIDTYAQINNKIIGMKLLDINEKKINMINNNNNPIVYKFHIEQMPKIVIPCYLKLNLDIPFICLLTYEFF